MLGSLWANRVEIFGGVNVAVDLISELDVIIQGGVKTGGKLHGRNINISGGANVKEDVKASNLTISGGLKANGKIVVDGITEIIGGIGSYSDINAGQLTTIGGLTAEGSVKIKGILDVRGKIEVEKNIECDDFIFKISGPSYIRGKLSANKIRIERDEFAKSEAFLNVTEIVSPNRIEIDYVIAERVVCPKLKAGQNTRIGEPIEKAYKPKY